MDFIINVFATIIATVVVGGAILLPLTLFVFVVVLICKRVKKQKELLKEQERQEEIRQMQLNERIKNFKNGVIDMKNSVESFPNDIKRKTEVVKHLQEKVKVEFNQEFSSLRGRIEQAERQIENINSIFFIRDELDAMKIKYENVVEQYREMLNVAFPEEEKPYELAQDLLLLTAKQVGSSTSVICDKLKFEESGDKEWLLDKKYYYEELLAKYSINSITSL